jgi:aspartate aminotransferase
MHFDAIGRVPGDPILGLMEAYAQDPNPRKFDLGVGVYKDAQGLTPILRGGENRRGATGGKSETPRPTSVVTANPLFGKVINELVLGADSKLIAEQRAGATQTPGGTGALRLSADFIAQCLPGRGVWLSNPTWPIHETIFATAGVKVSHYPYVGSDNRLDIEAMLAVLKEAPKGDVVLLHACCHNPTGFDLSHDDWRRVLDVVRRRELLPLIDFAYQGFGDGLEQDAWSTRLFAPSCRKC